jgi:hypothetical protein
MIPPFELKLWERYHDCKFPIFPYDPTVGVPPSLFVEILPPGEEPKCLEDPRTMEAGEFKRASGPVQMDIVLMGRSMLCPELAGARDTFEVVNFTHALFQLHALRCKLDTELGRTSLQLYPYLSSVPSYRDHFQSGTV